MEYVANQLMDIKDVKDVSSLLAYFHSHLNWNLGLDSFEDVEDYLYDFTAADLGLKPEEFAKIKSLRQLPPLEEEQQWGIFCVEFAAEKFYITALRKILSCLVPKARNATKHAVWDEKDLLFLCFWGTGDNRTICVAHFEQRKEGLSIVRTIHCAPACEDPMILGHFEERLLFLQWPTDRSDNERWHNSWSAAFTTAYGDVIKTSKALAARMAEVAVGIKDTILEAMEVETANGFAHLLFNKVKQTLVHDLTAEDFASMYAQTIVYGLFSARCLDKTPEDFSVEEAIDLIPSTNPFLRGLMKDCLGVRHGMLSFDELGIGDVVEMFAHVDAAKIAADFGKQAGGGREDPVIYFYEDFLKAYDKEQKVKCGEFYTPMPVVGFMVRAVDHILKTRFDLPDGLATDATKKVEYVPEGMKKAKKKDAPAIQILDPATGTGTFIREIILNIYETFKGKNPKLNGEGFVEAWSRYVDRNVLPRLNAFELMMAPYAIAHMKLAMVLRDTGYDFKGDKRLQVYLTNSLEEPGNSDKQMMLFDDDPLAAESVAANAVKKNTGINIVIGNPPYNGESKNKGKWIMKLMEGYKKEPGGKQKLKERNSKWINADEVKFIRLAQDFVERSGSGVLAYINPHGFIDNPTYRGMRWRLMQAFDEIYVLNLHGNSKKKEKCPDGSKDENVFDIQQGVSINIFVKRGVDDAGCVIHYADLYGLREAKYAVLEKSSFANIKWQSVVPTEPMCFFAPKRDDGTEEYEKGFRIDEIFDVGGVGITSKRDDVAIQYLRDDIKRVVSDYAVLSESVIKEKYAIQSETEENLVSSAIDNVKTFGQDDRYICKITYRPFDVRWTYYTPRNRGFLSRPVYKVLRHFTYGINVGLITGRQGHVVGSNSLWNLISVTTNIVDLNVFYRGGGCTFPLYLYQDFNGKVQRMINLNQKIVKKIEESLRASAAPREITPEDVFNYIYAVLHSPTYRQKYKEFLKIDFPRIPYPTDAKMFHVLAALGAQLVAIHTMKDFDEAEDVDFDNAGGAEVVKVEYKDGAVYINKSSRFTNVECETFDQYIGGYQPLQKWLKDRKGRTLSADDISHYKRIVRALRRTAALMSEIDKLPVVGE